MMAPQLNPRRRYLNKDCPHPTFSLPSSSHHHDAAHQQSSTNLPLKKSSTFHSPTTPPAQDDDPIVNIPLLPRRSPTCPKSLEDAVAAGEKRIQNLIGAVDRSLSGLETFSNDSQETLGAGDLPVPRFLLGARPNDPDHMDLDPSPNPASQRQFKQRPRRKHHSSDSGIGSTVTGSEDSASKVNAANNSDVSIHSSVREIQSGINGTTAPSMTPASGLQHALSEYACRHIQKHIISPIVAEPSLKNFHPLVRGIPFRVSRKEITCLRDLEKVLLWLAPVRQYAAMITASRARQAGGKEMTDDDVAMDERLGLHGGLSQNGQPAELVRIKNGQSISLLTGSAMDPSGSSGGEKHTLDKEFDDDTLRSMARRRKSAQAAVKQVQQCRDCDKIFKRPCDLTKHEKTHSRPWKCSEKSCKYHDYGWPTEKERDRHVNDKHSASPSMYKCQYRPCPYESKRESNCKQHMEKAHGWAYVRSKNNGKTKKSQVGKTPPTPQVTTPSFDASSPEFGGASCSHGYGDTFSVAPSINGSEDSRSHSALNTPFMDLDDRFAPFEVNDYSWNESYQGMNPANPSPFTPSSHRLSFDAGSMTNAPTNPSSFENLLTPHDQVFTENYDWSNIDTNNDFTSLNIQLATPASSIETRPLDAFSCNPSICVDQAAIGQVPSLSPGAQGNVMLYSPYSQNESTVDEGYEDFSADAGKPTEDFELFDSAPCSASMTSNGSQRMFQDLSNFVPSVWSGRGTALAQQLGMNNLMEIDDE
ncbi:MAG: hypothetical protein L6R42_002924 [Xanthoria sp. 1 TBL-2021]|nr:MAG: hypothetical protein L6R42_002924 [Xanthoria sp. 1 TBL-2021]